MNDFSTELRRGSWVIIAVMLGLLIVISLRTFQTDITGNAIHFKDSNSSEIRNAQMLNPGTRVQAVPVSPRALSGEASSQSSLEISAAAECGNCIIDSDSVSISSTNEKNRSRYSEKKVFFISDQDWKDVLSLVPVSVWSGNEDWCKRGYGTPSDVCAYPLLVYHQVPMKDEVDITKLYRSLDYSLALHTESGDNITTWSWRYPCTEEGAEQRLYLVKPILNASVIRLGDAFTMNITIANCDKKPNKISSIDAHFSQLRGYFTSFHKDFTGNDRTVAANSTKNLTAELRFAKALPAAIDADSIIYFMQQYSADNITVIGATPQELLDLLVADEPFGAGLNPGNIERIGPSDYFSYWSDYNTLIYCEENYSTAILASAYASLHDMPLVITNSSLEGPSVFLGKNVICIGNVSYPGLDCSASYTPEILRQKYIDETGTDKLILYNPTDWDVAVGDDLVPKRTANIVYDIYSKTSLGSAYLAAAKRELLIPLPNSTAEAADLIVKKSIRQYFNSSNASAFITIMASPGSIPFRGDFPGANPLWPDSGALDLNVYGDMDKDNVGDLYVGRIAGITPSDVFGYISRDIFYDSMPMSDNMAFLARSFDELYAAGGNISAEYRQAGYNASYYRSWTSDVYKGQHLVQYLDHGGPEGGGLRYYELPELDNTLNFEFACATCYALGTTYSSYCANLIRMGSIFYMGAVDTDYLGNEDIHFLTQNSIYLMNEPVGKALQNASKERGGTGLAMILGDPAFAVNPKHKLKEPLKPWYTPWWVSQ